jgi:hypothetical protein
MTEEKEETVEKIAPALMAAGRGALAAAKTPTGKKVIGAAAQYAADRGVDYANNRWGNQEQQQSEPKWQEQLKMGGAVTTATGGTSALFNNKALRGRKRAKKKER